MSIPLDAQKVHSELSKLREQIQDLSEKLDRLEQARPGIRTEHPHIVRMGGVHGGRPIVRGTGGSV